MHQCYLQSMSRVCLEEEFGIRRVDVQGVLPAGAVAALHLTYNATGLSPGTYQQNITINSNDLKTPQTRLKACALLLQQHFCICLPLNAYHLVPAMSYHHWTSAEDLSSMMSCR